MNMRIIDAHVHLSRIASFADTARLYSGVDYSKPGLLAECAACGVVRAIGMGVTETATYGFPDANAPMLMGCDLDERTDGDDLAAVRPLLAVCPGINPHKLDTAALDVLERAFIYGAAGVKLYPGYYPFTPDDAVYEPVYDLAERYGKPVVIHTGDTYSERGLLEYARPLHIDRVAVRRRGVNFVLAHMGDPWILEACELAYKNPNVYIDLSGLIVGGADEIRRVTNEPLLANRFRQGLLYLNDYAKVLYGSDWPLVPMQPYIAFCETLVPAAAREAVFYGNAERLFGGWGK